MAEAEPAPLRIAVGSKNPVKLAAVRQAFFRAFPYRPLVCVGHDVPSGVPDQPWGRDETQSGALQRARGACMAETGADYAVGIEGGVEEGNYGLRSVAYVAIRRGRDLRMSVEHTASFVLPPRVERLVRGQEPGHGKLELGAACDLVFNETNSKQQGGTVGAVTRGLLDRTAYYEQAVVCALAPFLHDDSGLYNAPWPQRRRAGPRACGACAGPGGDAAAAASRRRLRARGRPVAGAAPAESRARRAGGRRHRPHSRRRRRRSEAARDCYNASLVCPDPPPGATDNDHQHSQTLHQGNQMPPRSGRKDSLRCLGASRGRSSDPRPLRGIPRFFDGEETPGAHSDGSALATAATGRTCARRRAAAAAPRRTGACARREEGESRAAAPALNTPSARVIRSTGRSGILETNTHVSS